MGLKGFFWKFIVSRVARSRGLIDPVQLLARLESFAQPIEVREESMGMLGETTKLR